MQPGPPDAILLARKKSVSGSVSVPTMFVAYLSFDPDPDTDPDTDTDPEV